jgi:hypothetical protein
MKNVTFEIGDPLARRREPRRCQRCGAGQSFGLAIGQISNPQAIALDKRDDSERGLRTPTRQRKPQASAARAD